jgi:hypothetical protein
MPRIAILLLLAIFPSVAFANAGLPMLAILWPLSLPAFLPVVFIESYLLNKDLSLGYRNSLNLVTKANIFSTAIGIPIAWVACFTIEMLLMMFFVKVMGAKSYPSSVIAGIPEPFEKIANVLLTFPWMGPWKEGGQWIIPFATALMLVPCFYVSYLTEYGYILKKLPNENKTKLLAAVKKANLYTYALLLFSCLVWFLTGHFNHA